MFGSWTAEQDLQQQMLHSVLGQACMSRILAVVIVGIFVQPTIKKRTRNMAANGG